MELSPNFTLEELCKSQTALRQGIDNTPRDDGIIAALTAVTRNILQPVRDHYGVPIAPSSGYRCAELNGAIGGAATSQHVKGQAVDFEVPGVSNLALAAWVEQTLDFDQLILECYTPGEPTSGWVHCSYVGRGENRKQVLTYDGRSYSEGMSRALLKS